MTTDFARSLQSRLPCTMGSQLSENQPVQTASAQPPAGQAAQPPKDAYERYGISKIGPDGKPKSDTQLYKELHDAQLAEKRRANPNYGTIWNMGNIFKDE